MSSAEFARDVEGTRFVRIGRLSFLRRMGLTTATGSAVGVFIGGNLESLIRILLPHAGIAVDIAVPLGVGVTAGLLGLAIGALLIPGFSASTDGTRVRIRRHAVPADALQRASLRMQTAARTRHDLVLELRTTHLRTAVWLRTRTRILLDEDERALLLRVLAASSIEPPRSPHDPAERFTHVNFPGALTKDEAIDLVQRMPQPGQPLPLTQ